MKVLVRRGLVGFPFTAHLVASNGLPLCVATAGVQTKDGAEEFGGFRVALVTKQLLDFDVVIDDEALSRRDLCKRCQRRARQPSATPDGEGQYHLPQL